MGTYAANILPNTSGLDLGSTGQRWDLFAQSINADAVISSSTNPATTGTWKLANLDTINWRRADNVGDYSLFLTDVSATVIEDLLSYSGPGIQSNAFVTGTANAADAGAVRLAVSDAVNFRNNANNSNVQALSLNGSDQVVLGGSAGLSLPGPTVSSFGLNYIDLQGPKAAVTGNATIFTKDIPGGRMPAGRGIRIIITWSHTGSASVQYQLTYGASVLGLYSSAGSGQGIWVQEIWNAPGVTNAQLCRQQIIAQNSVLLFAGGFTQTARDTTVAQTLALGIAAGSDTITPQSWSIELIV